ncbi:MAG: hypothetical protein WA093_04175, partial [Minisyncoccales bacterium]
QQFFKYIPIEFEFLLKSYKKYKGLTLVFRTKFFLANFPVAKKRSMRPGTDFSDKQSANENIATANVTIPKEE